VIPSLRRRHFFAWIIIALILPVLFILSWKAIPNNSSPVGFGQLETSKNTDPWVIASEHREGVNNYLVLKLSRALAKPSILVYIGSSPTALVSESTLLGRVEGSGTYKFKTSEKLTREAKHLLFYDPIHGKIIDSIPI